MLALKINDVKNFMNQLLIGDTFDQFPMAEASITTFNNFSIDGMINKDFYDTDTQNILTQNHKVYSTWNEIKSFCFSIIRGKRTPLQFKIIFQFTPEQLSLIMDSEKSKEIASFSSISSLFLNIQYKNHMLLCTTGISQKVFSLDKSTEQQWDSAVRLFFYNHHIDYDTF